MLRLHYVFSLASAANTLPSLAISHGWKLVDRRGSARPFQYASVFLTQHHRIRIEILLNVETHMRDRSTQIRERTGARRSSLVSINNRL
jgi:hypothetical protein